MVALEAAKRNKLSGSKPALTRTTTPAPKTEDRTIIDIAGYFFTNVDIFFLFFCSRLMVGEFRFDLVEVNQYEHFLAIRRRAA
jgi:hypothetical protein